MAKLGRPFGQFSAPYASVSNGCGVYLMQLDDGLVKVGFSRSMRDRIVQHARALHRCGNSISKLRVYERFDWRDEQRCIHRLSEVASVKSGTLETFYGLNFETACDLVQEVLERHLAA